MDLTVYRNKENRFKTKFTERHNRITLKKSITTLERLLEYVEAKIRKGLQVLLVCNLDEPSVGVTVLQELKKKNISAIGVCCMQAAKESRQHVDSWELFKRMQQSKQYAEVFQDNDDVETFTEFNKKRCDNLYREVKAVIVFPNLYGGHHINFCPQYIIHLDRKL